MPAEPESARRLAAAMAAAPEVLGIRVGPYAEADDERDDSESFGQRMVGSVVALALVGGVRHVVGSLDILEAEARMPECRDDLEYVGSLLGRRWVDVRPCVVSGSVLDERYRGRGLGVEMYASAVWWTSRTLRQPLMAHACGGYETSAEAARVWASSRFRAVASVRGLVAAWAGDHDLAADRDVVVGPPRRAGGRRR